MKILKKILLHYVLRPGAVSDHKYKLETSSKNESCTLFILLLLW